MKLWTEFDYNGTESSSDLVLKQRNTFGVYKRRKFDTLSLIWLVRL